MSMGEILMTVAILGVMILTQFGTHALTARRFVAPLLMVAGVAYYFLGQQGIPTLGGDAALEMGLAVAGVACGVLAASVVSVTRNPLSGKIVARAGLAYVAVWTAVFGGRMAFAWGASNLWQRQLMEFSIQHQITGAAAWTAAFVLMAIAMVAARTLVLAARAAVAARPTVFTEVATSSR